MLGFFLLIAFDLGKLIDVIQISILLNIYQHLKNHQTQTHVITVRNQSNLKQDFSVKSFWQVCQYSGYHGNLLSNGRKLYILTLGRSQETFMPRAWWKPVGCFNNPSAKQYCHVYTSNINYSIHHSILIICTNKQR